MSSSQATDKDPALPAIPAVSDQETASFQAVLPRGIRKMRYMDVNTGRTRWEPMWFFQGAMLLCVIYVFTSLYNNPTTLQSSESWFLFLTPWLFLVVACLQYMPQRITINKDGICYRPELPGGIEKLQKTGVERRWSDLECVRFVGARSMSDAALMVCGRCDSLALDWRSNARLLLRRGKKFTYSNTTYINLWALSDSQREELFATLSSLVPQELMSPEVLYLQVKSLSGAAANNLNDYTHVWLEEYNRRFEISNYVPLPPGSTLGDGRFTVRLLIAARVNSSTYLALTSDNERVVIKELVAPLDSDDSMQKKLLEQFNREAALLAGLDHPSIIKVIDHFIENGRSYIVMEQASGKNMREYVRLRGSLPEAEVRQIAEQLVAVLQYLHEHEPVILHRDFTPDNLIYDESGRITVIDFGAANVFNTGKTATLIGKQGFMPPEQLRGKPSPASDIYAFGATLSFLLSGRDMPNMATLPVFEAGQVSEPLATLLQACVDMEARNRPDCDQIATSLNSMKSSSTGRPGAGNKA